MEKYRKPNFLYDFNLGEKLDLGEDSFGLAFGEEGGYQSVMHVICDCI